MTITKPLVDDREYHNIVLSNGMEVLLVQDPTTDKAAAALDVGVGSFADPPDLPGLAHFLEHLLFMGTEKYPSENEYAQFLTDHAGMFNAYTAAEHTNYHFEVGWNHLHGCLDRFAQFFISPLFSESCKSREIMAVDSENKKNLQNDVWRMYQLEKHFSNPEHPIHHFATGNYQTLGEIPEAKGIDVRDRLIEFYKLHYTASIMKLVVIGRESLDVLEAWARELFSAVPNTHPELANADPVYIAQPTLRPEDLSVVIKVRPVMDIKVLELAFPVPDQQPLHDTQPYHYYVHLLGHESKGSLLYYLKEKQWAAELGCAISHICKGTDYFFVNIELTNKGMNHWHDVVEALFAYVVVVKEAGPQKWIFDEISTTSRTAFLYRQKSKAMPLSSSLAQVLHRPIPRERLLDYSVPTKYEATAIADFAKYLTPSNVRIMLASQSLEGLTEREKWYGTEHLREPLAEVTQIRTPELHLPHTNDFLPSNFDLATEARGAPVQQHRPRMLLDSPDLRLWHKLDDTFMIPKANIFVKLINAPNSSSARSMRLADMFTAMVNDQLADYSYYADIADVSYSLTTVQDGFEVEIHGFSEKLNKLLEVVIKTLCQGELAASRFNVVKEQQERQLSNLMLAQPSTQRALQSNHLLAENMYSIDDRLSALKEITFENVVEFADELRNRRGMGVEMLVLGNANTQDALRSAEIVRNITPSAKQVPDANEVSHRLNSSFLYPAATQYYHSVELADPENVNSAILVCYQFGENNTELSATLSIIAQILKEATFNQLRTKEQLGYIVGSNKRQLRSTLWLQIFVQSEEPTEYLEERVENFVQNVARPLIAELSDEEYKRNVDAMIVEQLEKNKNLTEEASQYWGAINGGFYDFYRRQRLAKAAGFISKKHVLAAFDKYVVDSEQRSRFALHLKSRSQPPPPSPEAALARAVGQLVTERDVQIAPKQIQQFAIECRGLSTTEALQKLCSQLVSHAGLSTQQAKDFVATAAQRADKAGQARRVHKEAIGSRITSIQDYYKSVGLAQPPKAVDSLAGFKQYEDGDAKL